MKGPLGDDICNMAVQWFEVSCCIDDLGKNHAQCQANMIVVHLLIPQKDNVQVMIAIASSEKHPVLELRGNRFRESDRMSLSDPSIAWAAISHGDREKFLKRATEGYGDSICLGVGLLSGQAQFSKVNKLPVQVIKPATKSLLRFRYAILLKCIF